MKKESKENNESLKEGISFAINEILANLSNVSAVSQLEGITNSSKNVFLEGELSLLRALIYQAPYCQTSDLISQESVQEMKNIKTEGGTDKKLLAIEYTLINLGKIYLLSEDIPYSWENETIVKHLLNGNLEMFFDHYFESVEGFSCSSDKTSHLLNCIKKGMKTGEVVNTYSEYDFGEGLKTAYWSPNTIKTDKEALALFNKEFFSLGKTTQKREVEKS